VSLSNKTLHNKPLKCLQCAEPKKKFKNIILLTSIVLSIFYQKFHSDTHNKDIPNYYSPNYYITFS